jgi:hypothetical protein
MMIDFCHHMQSEKSESVIAFLPRADSHTVIDFERMVVIVAISLLAERRWSVIETTAHCPGLVPSISKLMFLAVHLAAAPRAEASGPGPSEPATKSCRKSSHAVMQFTVHECLSKSFSAINIQLFIDSPQFICG